jgi:hypothetical protein
MIHIPEKKQFLIKKDPQAHYEKYPINHEVGYSDPVCIRTQGEASASDIKTLVKSVAEDCHKDN